MGQILSDGYKRGVRIYIPQSLKEFIQQQASVQTDNGFFKNRSTRPRLNLALHA